MTLPEKIVNRMYAHDKYSQWLGIEVMEIKVGYCKIKMKVNQHMTNGFGIAHGGISYGFADSAFAFASNSEGRLAVSIETSISHTKAVNIGDILIAKAHVMNSSNRLAIYQVVVNNQNKDVVALFKGTVYKKSESWETILK